MGCNCGPWVVSSVNVYSANDHVKCLFYNTQINSKLKYKIAVLKRDKTVLKKYEKKKKKKKITMNTTQKYEVRCVRFASLLHLCERAPGPLVH